MIVTPNQQIMSWLTFIPRIHNQSWKKIFAIWQQIFTNIKISMPAFKKQPTYTYAFSQQTNPDCHLQMWTNFQLLQLFRANQSSNSLVIHPKHYLSHRNWLGQGFSNYSKWLQAKNQPALKRYFDESIKQAPLYPYFFDKLGNNFFSKSLNPFEAGERKSLSPYFMKEVALSELSYILPIYQGADILYGYDADTNEYKALQGKGFFNGESIVLTSGQKKALPIELSTLKLQRKSKSNAFITAQDSSMAIGDKFIPRDLGIYKLLLLNLNLNSDNEQIDLNHPDQAVAIELQETMKKIKTSWDPAVCKKEHLIEYALAELFKEDLLLFEEVKYHVDFFFKAWSFYEKTLLTLYDQNGEPLKNKNLKRYLPGKEQMLAYCLMKNIQYLWLNAISTHAFCQHLSLPTFVKFIPAITGPNSYFKAAYVKKVQDNQSFIEVWKKIHSRLLKKFPDKKDWVSFSGHGIVISFDSNLIQQQNERKISNQQLANDLNIACIDSLYGKVMDVFYRKVNK